VHEDTDCLWEDLASDEPPPEGDQEGKPES
jgi:hypothetical protein